MDPSKPSIPISYPIKTIEELVSRSYFNSFHYPFNKSSVPLPSYAVDAPNRERVLVCHDMAGGYLEDSDKWIQGGTNADGYAIWHWYLIDVFVYFSHNLVVLPPPAWVNAAHKHGVKVLGTFITEWEEGKKACDKLLSSPEFASECAERLVELATRLGFDGWLLNIENELDAKQIPALKVFIKHLTQTMHQSKPGSLVIWYDSVIENGSIRYQNQLNEMNKPFFDLCDGLFTNYWWQKEFPKRSGEVAGDRKFDVYMGNDVWGRNTYGGGQWNTHVALKIIKESNVSAALFAPGWVKETNQPPNFQTAQNRWWSLVEESMGVMKSYPRELPFYSDFDQGRGHHVSIEGRNISNADWWNLSCQSFQPFLEFHQDPESYAIQAVVDFNAGSYNGGGNIAFRGNLGSNAYFTTRLFRAELPLGDRELQLSYSAMSNGDSLIGFALLLSSTEGKEVPVLVASHGDTLLTMNKFSSKFEKVIMPRQISRSATGSVAQVNTITMPGYTLKEIQAVCYKLNPTTPDTYYAVLSLLLIQTSGHNVQFPPSSSWAVIGNNISWNTASNQLKTVSLNLSWSHRDNEYDHTKVLKYYIYAMNISDNEIVDEARSEGKQYMGVAVVQAFYVSDLVVPPGTSAIKFYIQLCGIDGTFQPLVTSPSFLLKVEG